MSKSNSQRRLKRHPIICGAIKKKAVIQFRYPTGLRAVEPQAHGISSAGNEVIRAVRTYPLSTSGKTIEGKFYTISQMSELKNTGGTFSGPGPHFNPNDKGMIYVHCSLEQDKTSSQRVARIKKVADKQQSSAEARLVRYRKKAR